jgi:nitroreductase
VGGIVFFKTTIFEAVKKFYLEILECTVWLEQSGICIVRHGNQLIGICRGNEADVDMLLTFFYSSREEIDAMAMKLTPIEMAKYNPDFDIYHFYTTDPEGRRIEIQAFEHPVEPYSNGSDLLRKRRSIRQFQDKTIPQESIDSIFEDCRYSPTSRNSESYYYVVIKNKEILDKISTIREGATAPIGRAPVAIAVCSDPEKTVRVQADADIAATYLLLAIENNDLGGCWITDMDRSEVKEMLDIPQSHYLCMITPIGFPAEKKGIPSRREIKEIVRYIN